MRLDHATLILSSRCRTMDAQTLSSLVQANPQSPGVSGNELSESSQSARKFTWTDCGTNASPYRIQILIITPKRSPSPASQRLLSEGTEPGSLWTSKDGGISTLRIHPRFGERQRLQRRSKERKGKDNCCADTLSRLGSNLEPSDTPTLSDDEGSSLVTADECAPVTSQLSIITPSGR